VTRRPTATARGHRILLGPADALAVAEAVLTTQRDFGDRKNRQHARPQVHHRRARDATGSRRSGNDALGHDLAAARPYQFESNGRPLWVGEGSERHLALHPLHSERTHSRSRRGGHCLTGLARDRPDSRRGFPPDRNIRSLIIANVSSGNKPRIDELLDRYGLQGRPQANRPAPQHHGLRGPSQPVVWPMAESERTMPSLLDRLDTVVRAAGWKTSPLSCA